MTMKKMTALALAVVMCLSLAATAFAVDVTDATKAANVKVTGTTTVPTIKIEVPAAAAVVLNPYAMKLNADLSGAVDSASGTEQSKVISPVYAIKNMSNIDIKVGVTATGTATGVTFSSSSVATLANKEKKAFVQLVMKAVEDGDAATATLDPENDKVLVLSTTAVTLKAEDQLTLVAGDGENVASSGNSDLVFQFQGDTSATPTIPWTNKDVVGANLAFTFAPQDVA